MSKKIFRKNFSIYLPFILLLLVAQISCFAFIQNRKIKLGENFVLQTGETAETENGKLKVRLKGVGRTISEGGETEYAELQIRLNKSEQTIEISERGNGKREAGNFIIELINAESFGKTNCELKISRKD